MIRLSKRWGNAVLVEEELIPAYIHTYAGKVLPYSNGKPPTSRVFFHPDKIRQTWFYPDMGIRLVDFTEAD